MHIEARHTSSQRAQRNAAQGVQTKPQVFTAVILRMQ
jgi:hypothetical protein